jgi:glucokinase
VTDSTTRRADAIAANVAAPEHFRQVGSGATVDGGAVVTMAIGARFTMRVTPAGRPAETVASHAGQLVLHSHEADETAVLDVLRRCHGQLAVAQVLCEPGIFEIYRSVCQLRGIRASHFSAAQVVHAASRSASPECAHALSMFCGLLGDAAGRAALTLGCTGGVFVEGAVVAQLGDAFARSPFRRRFEGTGRFADTLRAIPTFMGRGQQPGVANLAAWRDGRRYCVL